MGKAIFITGTGTGVGKTFFSYLLCKSLKNLGVKVSYWKPIETGVKDKPADAALIADLLGQPLKETVGYTFELPLSPYAAEKYEGEKVNKKALREMFLQKLQRSDLLVIEGAGGIAVPIKKNYTFADFIAEINVPVIVVADARLGTINHSFLTAFYAKAKGLRLVGFTLNRFTGKDVAEKDNPFIVEEMTGSKVLFEIPETDLENFELEEKKVKDLLADIG